MKKRTFQVAVHMASGKTFRSCPLAIKDHEAFIDDIKSSKIDVSKATFYTVLTSRYVRFNSDRIEATTVKESSMPTLLSFVFYSIFNRARGWF